MENTAAAETEATQERKQLPFIIIDGIKYLTVFSPVTLKEASDYKPQPGDVCIDIYPRCGSHWMQNIVLNIFRKGRDIDDPKEFRLYCPLIESMGLEGIRKMPKPGAYKTHLPFTAARYSSEAKYIFLARNAKDCCVANYNFLLTCEGLGLADMEFNDYFELFLAGEVYCNDYWDHLLSWYPYRNKPNVFYTTYEYMKQNTAEVVKKLAAFLGEEYIKAIEQESTVLQNILVNTAFDSMKKKLTPVFTFKRKDLSNMYPEGLSEGLIHIKKQMEKENINKPTKTSDFFRKGIVGDWKNWLTPEQAERMDRKSREKLKNTEILHWFPQ